MPQQAPLPVQPTRIGQRFRQLHPEPALRLDVVRSLRMHPRVAAAVTLLVLVVLLGYASRMKPVYQAESRVYIEPAASSPLNDPNGGGLFDSTKYDSYLQQQMQTATRLDVIAAALKSLPQQDWQEFGPNVTAASARLQGALKVERITTSNLLGISLKGSDPEKTAKIVNAVTDAYLAAGRKDEVARSDSRAQILEEERQRIARELDAARTEQAALSRIIGVAGPASDIANPYDQQLAAVRAELVTAREQHDAAAAQLSSVVGAKPTQTQGLNALANDLANGDAGLSSMKAAVNQRRAQLESQMAGLKPGNPIYKQDQDELADLDRSLDSMSVQLRDQAARRLQDKLRTELERTGDLEARLNGELARGTAAATTAAPKLQRSAELTASIARLTTRYATVDDALRTLALETNGLPMAHLSLAATAPAAPEASRQKLVLFAALPLALLCGCLAASMLHKRERRIFISRDMEDVLGFAPIAVIPSRADVSDRVVEAYVLRLAAGVEGAYRSDGARAFVVTPASASTTIQPLLESVARKLEDLGLTVARLRAAEMLDTLPGDSETGTAEARSLAQTGDGGRETVVSAALDRLRQAHDIVFIDAAALLTSAEAEYLARCADATILVAECGVTLKQELFDAAALLERLQVTGVGTVLDELQLRYADSAFRQAVEQVERRPEAAPFTRRVRTERPDRPEPQVEAVEPVAQETVHEYPVEHPHVEVEPVSVLTYGMEPDSQPVEILAEGDAQSLPVAPVQESPALVAASAVPFEAADTPNSVEIQPVTKEANVVNLPEAISVAPDPVAAANTPAAVPAEPAVPAVPAPEFSAPERAVWPAVSARSDRDDVLRQAEQEMLQANGTSVFLRPRRVRVERLEPLGVQAELAPSADILANSFGSLPIEIESEAGSLFRDEPKLSEAELIRAANERKAAEIRKRAVQTPAPVPLHADEIRRLLAPVRTETSIETRNGKDMIGARAVSRAVRETRLEGWVPDGDNAMTEKRNWFQKLFTRDIEPLVKIVPQDEDEDENGFDDGPISSRTSLYDLTPAEPYSARSHSNGTAAAVAEPVTREFVRESSSQDFKPVARMVSVLTPVVEPVVQPVEASAPKVDATAAPVAAVTTPVAAAPEVQPAPAAAAAPRRPKSFLELSQNRLRPQPVELVAEPVIAAAHLVAEDVVIAETPVAAEPVISEPVAAEPVVAEPVAAEPVAPEPVALEPVVPEPEMHALAAEVPEAIEVLPQPEPEPEPDVMAAKAVPEAVVAPVVAEPIAAAVVETPAPVRPVVQSKPLSWDDVPQVRSSADRWPERPSGVSQSRPQPTIEERALEYARVSTASRPVQPAPSRAVLSEDHVEPRLATRRDFATEGQSPSLSRRWGLLSRYQSVDEQESGADSGRR